MFIVDPLKWDFMNFKMDIISIRKRIVGMDMVRNVTSTCQSVITHTHMVILFL